MEAAVDSAQSIFSYSRSRSNSCASQSSALERSDWHQLEEKKSPLGQVFDALESGDETVVRQRISSGVDVNGEDEEGRSVIAYLVLGATSFKDTDLSNEDVSRALSASMHFRLRILRYLRTRGKFSLYTLNAALGALGGLTPLGMAAYLARLDFVKVLYEGGLAGVGEGVPGSEKVDGDNDGAVLVDGLDVHRATPIMYAARDGHLDIVQYLLDNGARADAADYHHRSVLFYASTHPACLWACERSLRLKRARTLLCPRARRRLKLNLPHDINEYASRTIVYEAPPFAAAPGDLDADHPDVQASLRPLVTAIRRGDVAAVHNLLFPAPQSPRDAPPPVPPKDRPLGSKYSCSSLSSQFALGAHLSSESDVVRPRPRSSSLPFARHRLPSLSASASTSALPTIAQEPPSPPAPATLVNLRDACGWAPIHYALAATRPSARVLDALYLAGADLALYTGNNQDSPLHCLARADPTAPSYASSSRSERERHGGFSAFQLYAFITHAVRDLGAPLDAKDLDGNTALHIAAAEGHSLDVLMALLDCDTDGEVRKMKNVQGYTAFDLAKPEFRIAFDSEEAFMRPASAASVRTVRPSASCSSFASTSSNSTLSSSSSSSSIDMEEMENVGQFPPRRTDEEDDLRAELTSVVEAEKVVNELKNLAGKLEKAEKESDEREFDLESRPPVRGSRGLGEAGTEEGDELDLDDLEIRLHDTWKGASDILERYRKLVDLAIEDLAKARGVKSKLLGLIERLERRLRKSSGQQSEVERWEVGTDVQEEDDLFVDCENARSLGRELRVVTPTLTHSAGSSSAGSFASLASFTLSASDSSTGIRELAEVAIAHDDDRGEIFDWRDPFQDNADLLPPFDLDKRQSTQKRSRSGSVVSAISSFDGVSTTLAPLEDSVELISVPPIVALEATAPTSPINLSFNSPTRTDSGASWLGPYVRQTNSLTFQQHLQNLMEIERTLFGDEDEEREDGPQYLGGKVDFYGCDSMEENMDWRDCVEHLIEDVGGDTETIVEVEGASDDVLRRNAVYVEEGNFLDMFAGGNRARTPSPPRSVTPERHLSPLDLLIIAKREVSQLEETMLESEKCIDRAQRYLTQAEHLTSKVFQAKEHALQAARLSHALRELCGEEDHQKLHLDRNFESVFDLDMERCSTPELCSATRAPASSPIAARSTAALDQFFAVSTSPSRNASAFASAQISRQPSMQSLLEVPAPLPLQLTLSASAPAPISTIARAAEEDDMRQLRRLLLRKIPARLEGVLDSVGRAGTWAGVLQSVICKLQARH